MQSLYTIALIVLSVFAVLSVPILGFVLNRQSVNIKAELLGDLRKEIQDCISRNDALEIKLDQSLVKYGQSLETIEIMRSETNELQIAKRRLVADLEDERKIRKHIEGRLDKEEKKTKELSERVLYLERQNERLEKHNQELAKRLDTKPFNYGDDNG